jgi:mercuric ion transport protein
MSGGKRDGLRILGLGAAVCAACCAGPILAVLGGLSLAGIVSTVFIGVAGLVIAAVAAAGLIVVRRRRAAGSSASTAAEPVPVAPATSKLTVR